VLTWKIIIGAVVILGGIGVVGSYIIGAVKNPVGAQALWGGVPKNVIPLYTLGMVLSAIGFLSTTYYIFFRVDAAAVRIWPGLDFRFFLVIYLLILIPSALWMTLTVRMVKDPGPGFEAGIRTVLILTAIGALFMLISMAAITPRAAGLSWWLAVIGSAFFFLHTAVLDAVIWTRLFFRNY
jgi:hypothetical protein